MAALGALFNAIANTRMQGVPVKNPPLKVLALGFAPEPQQPEGSQGVLVTPLCNAAATDQVLAVRQKATRQFGYTGFDYIWLVRDENRRF